MLGPTHPLAALILAPGLALAQSDDCANANSIVGTGAFPFSTVGLANDGTGCFGSPFGAGPDGWLVWVTGAVENYRLSIVADFPLRIVVRDACGGTQIGCLYGNNQLDLSGLVPNSAYFLEFDGQSPSSEGTGVLDIIGFDPPSNDECGNAWAIPATGVFPFDNFGATDSGAAASCWAGDWALDIWYAWTTGPFTDYRLSGTGQLRRISVYDACGGVEIACSSSELELLGLLPNTTYTLQLTRPIQDTGSLIIEQLVRPPNDDCTAATPISGTGVFTYDSSFATNGGGPLIPCTVLPYSADVWFEWTAGAATDYLVTLSTDMPEAHLASYDACGTHSSSELCTTASPEYEGALYLLDVVPNSTRWLRVDGAFYDGTGSFEISALTPPANDDCANAFTISGPGPHAFDNRFASTDGVASVACSNTSFPDQIEADVWFEWTAPWTGPVRLSNCDPGSIGIRVGIYAAGTCVPTSPIACGTTECWGDNVLEFDVVAGQTYTIQVGQWSMWSEWGQGTFRIDPVSVPPANDHCSVAEPISGSDWFVFDSNGATSDTGLACGGGPARGVWFAWNTGVATDYTFRVCDADFENALALWDGCDGSQLYCESSGGCWPFGDLHNSRIDAVGLTPDTAYWIQVDGWGDQTGIGTLEITDNGARPQPVGVNTCVGNPNSTGAGAEITAFGSASIADQHLVLEATSLPSRAPGFFYYGTQAIQVPFGGGVRCVGGTTQRLPVDRAHPSGVMLEPDVFQYATHNLSLSAGTFHFQAVYRDPPGINVGLNLTNALQITFTP